MNDGPENKDKGKKSFTPWSVLLLVWVITIYIIFTINFFGNFISHQGG